MPEPTPDTVPYARFAEIVAERDKLLGEQRTQARQLKDLEERAATSTTLAKQLEEEKAARQRDVAKFTAELALTESGVTDPDGREVAMLLHGRLPEKDRPPIADWLKSFKEKPDSAPRPLQSYLAAPAAPPPAAGGGKAPPPKPAAGGKQPDAPPAASSPISADAIRTAREQAQRTGDWAPVQEMIKQAKAAKGAAAS